MDVRITYCAVCGYEDRAREMADELRERFGAQVEIAAGKFGQFDVQIDGELVASRGESFLARMSLRDAPDAAAVIAAVERHLAPGEGEACEIPGAKGQG